MAASTEYSLKYYFDTRANQKLKPGDIVSSSCPPTDTLHNGRSVVYSPAGFPLHFTFRLVYAKLYRNKHKHVFEFQLHLEQPSGVPFLPPLHIQPIKIAADGQPNSRVTSHDRRQVGPNQPGIWGVTWSEPTPCQPHLIPFPWEGVFRFQLLSEPRDLLAALPAFSNTDWTILPGEMMSAVLRELPLADRVSARLVCHKWKGILDSDSLAWSNVSHLQSIGRRVPLEAPYGYNEGRLNQVRDHKLYQALGFLASRNAPIRSLELVQVPSDLPRPLYQGLKHLPSELSKRHIKLKALLFRSNGRWDANATESLVKLIQSQPSLERLYIEAAFLYNNVTYQAFARLRILSLDLENKEWLQACLPHLTCLVGLRLILPFLEHELEPQDAHKASLIESLGMGLRRAKGMDWPPEDVGVLMRKFSCRCPGSDPAVMVWGTGNLSPSTAAYLLMAPHDPAYHHYI